MEKRILLRVVRLGGVVGIGVKKNENSHFCP